MKKLSKEERIKRSRLNKTRELRWMRRVRRDYLHEKRRKSKGNRGGIRFSSVRVILPEIVSLERCDLQDSLAKCISAVKDYVCDPELQAVYVDLSNIKRLYPDGTLLFVSEIEAILDTEFGWKLKGVYPSDNVVEQLFQHIGLIEKLGLKNRIESIDSDEVVHWLYAYGDEGDLNSVVDDLPSLLTSSKNTSLRMAVTTGMSEAVANSSEHAYLVPREDGAGFRVKPKWWMFAKRENDDVCVVVCDLGAGIPGTLNKTWPEEFTRFLKTMIGRKQEDHQLIKFALKLGRTSTGLKNRGRGLKDIQKMVREEKVGHLVIFSNKGVYSYSGATQRPAAHSRNSSIHGTIVRWTIPIKAFEVMRGL